MRVLVDTGVWYSYCDERERPAERDAVEGLFETLRVMTMLVPWPVVYETIRTRFSKNRVAISRLETLLKSPSVDFVDDAFYRARALELTFEFSIYKQPARPMSMIDCLLRLMLADVNLKIDRFATFNERDFADDPQSPARGSALRRDTDRL